jgi:hypothetical protein
LTTTLSQEFPNREHSQELLRIHIKPLPKKGGGLDVRPISLIETTVKLIHKMFIPKLRFWASPHIPVLPEQYGFGTGDTAGDQMIRLLHDVRQTKRVSVLIPVDLKGAFLQFLNSKVLPPDWIPYLAT